MTINFYIAIGFFVLILLIMQFVWAQIRKLPKRTRVLLQVGVVAVLYAPGLYGYDRADAAPARLIEIIGRETVNNFMVIGFIVASMLAIKATWTETRTSNRWLRIPVRAAILAIIGAPGIYYAGFPYPFVAFFDPIQAISPWHLPITGITWVLAVPLVGFIENRITAFSRRSQSSM